MGSLGSDDQADDQADGAAAVRRILSSEQVNTGAVGEVVAAARASSPDIAALPAHEVARHIDALLRSVVTAVTGTGTGTGADADLSLAALAAESLAVDRALQGVPLASLLDGWHAGRSRWISSFVDAARRDGVSPDALLDVLLQLDDQTTVLQHRMIHAYRATELDMARTTHAVHAQALRDLMHGGPPSCLADAGLDPERRYHCLVADVTDPRLTRRAEAVLVPSGGIAGLVDGYLCAIAPRLPAVADVGALLVVVAPAVPAALLAEVYQLCQHGLVAARTRGQRGVHHLADLAAAVATDARPQLGSVLAVHYLAALDPSDSYHRLLVETALVYLELGHRLDPTATALHVHANTVKHRLRKLGELTAFSSAPPPADAVARTVSWWWALRTWLDADNLPPLRPPPLRPPPLRARAYGDQMPEMPPN